MTPKSTITLLRALFVIAAVFHRRDHRRRPAWFAVKGCVIGLFFSLTLVLADRFLKGLTLRLFSSATFGLLLGLFAATLLRGSDVLIFLPWNASGSSAC